MGRVIKITPEQWEHGPSRDEKEVMVQKFRDRQRGVKTESEIVSIEEASRQRLERNKQCLKTLPATIAQIEEDLAALQERILAEEQSKLDTSAARAAVERGEKVLEQTRQQLEEAKRAVEEETERLPQLIAHRKASATEEAA